MPWTLFDDPDDHNHYPENEYEGCPKCDSGDITEIGRDTVMHVDGMYRWHWMQCETCKHEWTESEPWL